MGVNWARIPARWYQHDVAPSPTTITQRLRAQLLRAGAPSVTAAVRQLLAVQAQELAGAQLALRARVPGLAPADLHRELTENRSLVVTWLNRGTLHLVTAEDYWWLQPLLAPRSVPPNLRLLAQLGLRPEQVEHGIAEIEVALARHGPLGRTDLRNHLRAAAVPVDGQIGYLLLALSGLRGRTVRGPMIGGEQAYVLVADWLGPPPPSWSRSQALAELARRYLIGHAPADAPDLARWAGIGLRDARAGFAAVADDAPRPSSISPVAPRLLGQFDPIMFGWVDRSPLLGDHEADLITRNGLFRPAILARDRVVGTWRYRDGAVTLLPLEPLTRTESATLQDEARAVVAFLTATETDSG